MLEISFAGFWNFLKTALFIVGYIANSSLFPEPLNKEEENIYLKKIINGDENARKVLIERNLRLVVHICKKYSNINIDQEDLISIGTIGLIKGINSYNFNKGTKLSTYVSKCIENEILMYLRSYKKQALEVYLEDKIGEDKDHNVITLKEVIENNDKSIEEKVDLKFKIKKLNNKINEILKQREKLILELRFGLKGDKPQTQKQIAKMLGISRSYVSRIESKAIEKLSKEILE